MQDRLQVSNVNEYPIIDPIIEIERKRTQAYYTIISISDKAAKDLISQLKEEYGSKSENFLKSNRTGPFFYRGTGTGSKTIASYVRFHPIEKKSMVILFDFDIKPIIEKEIQRFNEQNYYIEQNIRPYQYKPCNIL